VIVGGLPFSQTVFLVVTLAFCGGCVVARWRDYDSQDGHK